MSRNHTEEDTVLFFVYSLFLASNSASGKQFDLQHKAAQFWEIPEDWDLVDIVLFLCCIVQFPYNWLNKVNNFNSSSYA